MKNKDKSSFYCNNRCQQSNKHFCNFCKHLDHNIETYYHCNKLIASTYAVIVTNTESIQLMDPISA